MAENLGAIRYEIDMDTANMLRGEAVIDKSISGIVKDFDRADKAVRDFEESQRKLGRTINAVGQVLDKNGDVLAGLSNEYRQLAKTADTSFQTVNTRMNGVAQAVNGQLNQALTNTSYQIQDIAVQLAGGQNPFLVMAQQIPQLLVGFGALAAGIGAAVAVLGGLYLAFGDSASNAEKLEKAIERTQAVMTLGADGVAEYTEEMRKLSDMSKDLAKVRLAETIMKQTEIIQNSAAAIVDSAEETSDLYSSTFIHMRDLTESVANDIGGSIDDVASSINGWANRSGEAGAYLSRDLDNIAGKFDITRDEALKFGLALSDVANDKDALSIKSLQNIVEDLNAAYGYANPKLIKFSSAIIEFIQNSTNAVDTANELKKAIYGDGIGDAAEQASSKFVSLIQSLTIQRIELEKGKEAALDMRLQFDGLSDSERAVATTIYASNEAIRQQKEEAEQSAKAIKELNDDLDAFFAKESADSTRQDQQQTATLTRRVQTIGLTQLEEIQNRYNQEYDILRAAQERDIISKEEFAAREIQINKNKTDAINRYNQQQAQNNMLLSQSTQTTLGALGQAFGNFASIAEKGGAESFERYKKLAIGQALISTFLAANNALATPAPPPIPQILAGSIAALGMANVAQIKNQEYSGNREFGGPVSAGSMYRVGEKGNPEFFKNKSGQLSMIPGENGEVIPANKLMGGGVNWSINVENYGPDKAYATIDDINRTVNVRIGREVAGMRDGTSQFGKAMKASGNYKNRASS